MTRTPLAGSERTPLPGSRATGPADPTARFEVSVLVRRKNAALLDTRVAKLGRKVGAAPLTREAFAAKFGAAQTDLAKVAKFAAAHGLVVVQRDAPRRTVVLSGTVAQFNAAFGVELRDFEHPDGCYRGRVGKVHVPGELKGIVEAVLGLDDRPQARAHFRVRPTIAARKAGAKALAPTSYDPTQLASLYNFPSGTGSGQCIGIIELGGGYKPADLSAYFKRLGVTAPKVVAVSVDQGKNAPTGDPNGPDGEVMLDIEVAGAIAPGAQIAVYFAPNTDAGFLDAITTAVHDTRNKPSVISISWGGPESSWTTQAMTQYDQAFQAAAALGVSVCVAAGDNGSSDGVSSGGDHVDFPASSPHVLACGGTSLRAAKGAITSETVWNDGTQGGATGGGVSAVFALPAWQAGLKSAKSGATKKATALAKRGVPDVSAVADPQTGYNVRVDGQNTVIGGTSAVAPLWAGLIARINAAKGKPIGLFQAKLYANATVMRDITSGNNGDFSAAVGWDACTGLGSPNGKNISGVL